jgi:hypothetical protein
MTEMIHPSRRMRPSRYAQLEGTTVATLDEARRERLIPIADETDQDGKRVLQIRFPTPRGRHPVQVLDVSGWLIAPELAKAFAEMVVIWGADKTERTRQSFVGDLNKGFFKYLATRQDPMPKGLDDLSTVLINSFIDWLGRRENGVLVFASYTRLHYLGVLRTVIGQLKKTPSYAPLLPRDLHIRRIPWPGVSRQVGHPTEILSRPLWETLYRVCVGECARIMTKLEQGWRLIKNGTSEDPTFLPDRDTDDSLAYCLRKLDALCPGIIPSFVEIRRLDPDLACAIRANNVSADLALYFQPSARSLIPFVLLLGMVTSFSGETLLGARLSDLSQTEVLGSQRFVWRPYKARSRRRQHRSFPMTDAPDSPSVLVPFIERWTMRIRSLAAPRLQDLLFLWIPIAGDSQPHAFDSKDGPANGAWQDNLAAFLADRGLPHLTLRQIRATSLDLVHDLFAGDLRAVQAAGGQQRPEVILSHYTSDAARQRNDEQLGDVMALRTRWRETDGLLDPRTLPSGQDLAAATPGWRCLDPYDSPIPGQDKGKLCAAYGACPICPLAHLNGQDAYSLARVLQLRARIEAAQATLPAERWLKAWASRLQRLNDYWLPRFHNPEVIEAASRLDLDELPDLE